MNNKFKYLLASTVLATSLLGISVLPALAVNDPVNIAPAAGDVHLAYYPNGIEFSWQGIDNASSYRFIIYPGLFVPAPPDTPSPVGTKVSCSDRAFYCKENLQDTKVTVPTNIFTKDSTYTWFVQVLDNQGKLVSGSQGFAIKTVAADDPTPLVVTTKTACVDTTKNLQTISTKWNSVSGNNSYTATLYTAGGAVETSKCLDNTTTQYDFTKNYSASSSFAVAVTGYSDTNCTNLQTNIPAKTVVNGIEGSMTGTNILKAVSFDIGTGTNIPYPLNSCSPVKLHLTPPTNSFDTPIKVLISTSNPGKGPGEVQNNLFNYPFTVIFKYQPADSGSSSD